MRLATYALLPLFLVALSGCMSTEKRFERAAGLEERGDYAGAAAYYIQVLVRDPEWNDARLGLERVGAIAIDNHYDDARAHEGRGAFDEAIGSLDAMQSLYEHARDVGVRLTLPAGHEAYRTSLSTAAMRAMLQDAERAEDAGDWEEALAVYSRVQERFDLPTQQEEEVLLAMARVHVRWGEQEMGRAYFRAAHEHGAEVIRILGPDHPRAPQGFDLQEEAVRLGTRSVAMLPLWSSEEAAASAPPGLLSALNDMLIFDFWGEPPLFLHLADPVEVRRELRRLRFDTQAVSRAEAAEIGRSVDADLVVAGEVVSLQFEESRVRERTRATRTRGAAGVDTSYIEKSYTARLAAEIEYRVIDAESRRELDAGTVAFDVSRPMTRGIYAGDHRDLDLSRSERELFDEEEFEQIERDMEDELLDKLAPRLADGIFERLLKQIP